MIKLRTFYKKTRKGSIVKVVREHYLRDDIVCGSDLCPECEAVPAGKPSLFSEHAPKGNHRINGPHYLIFDTNVVMNDIDCIEDPLFTNIIICQTVLQEIRHRSGAIFKRIKDILDNQERYSHVFVNEFCQDTYQSRQRGETANDFNDRLIREAAAYYRDHQPVRTVFITNDMECLKIAKQHDIETMTMREYVSGFTERADLLDKLSISRSSTNFTPGQDIFPDYLSQSDIRAGLKTGKYMQSSFNGSRDNYLHGYCFVDGKTVHIDGRINLNRAIHEDNVVIELLPESQWTSADTEVKEDKSVDADNVDVLDDANQEVESKKSKDAVPNARVVGIIKRNWRQYCGVIQPSSLPSAFRHLVKLADRRLPKVKIETRQASCLAGKRIVVAIDSWPRDSKYPLGHYVRTLGTVGEKATENEVLLLEHDIPHQPFSANVLACLPSSCWILTEKDLSTRQDLRGLTICSVDPPGCTDIDDALHCRILPNGNYEAGVHIADVSYFVRPGTAIDVEAQKRSTTVYLTDNRIEMLPALLSSNICSLRGEEERLAFSVIWELNENAEIISTHYTKSVIKSSAALTYAQAQAIVDDIKCKTEIAESLRRLNKLAKILKQRRIDNGALMLASSEVRFHLDSETNDPLEVQNKQLLETNSLVEEFMLLANISTAERILQEFSESAVLRRHPSPPPSSYDALTRAAASAGLKLSTGSALQLARSLDAATKDCKDPYLDTILRVLATRCMMQAVYFAAGTLPRSEYSHYGLATPLYTHFTSPIRRYADVMVHRMLAAAIGADKPYATLLDKALCEEICRNINYRHRMAQEASRASVHLHTEIYFRNISEDCNARIMMVRKNALQVLIFKYGLEGCILIPRDMVLFDADKLTQTVGDHVFHTFDAVVVQVSMSSSEDGQHSKLQVKLVSPVVEGLSVAALETGKKRTSRDVSAVPEKKSRSK